jgi:hypothetical protein
VFSPLQTLDAFPGNLPLQLSSLVALQSVNSDTLRRCTDRLRPDLAFSVGQTSGKGEFHCQWHRLGCSPPTSGRVMCSCTGERGVFTPIANALLVELYCDRGRPWTRGQSVTYKVS